MNGIDVSRVVNNPRLQVDGGFQVVRNVYDYANEGEWTLAATETYTYTGDVCPAPQADKVKYLPEAQRAEMAVTVHCTQPLYMADGNGQEGDIVVWRGNSYRVQFSKPYRSYHFAIATRFVPGAGHAD
jgi:hypothetical protein